MDKAAMEQERNRRLAILCERMEWEIVYGPEFFRLSPELAAVVMLTRLLGRMLDETYLPL